MYLALQKHSSTGKVTEAASKNSPILATLTPSTNKTSKFRGQGKTSARFKLHYTYSKILNPTY